MSANRVNVSKRSLWEAAEQNAEEEVDSRTSEGSSSSSTDGSNQPHQNENSVISSNSCPASSSMPPRSNAIANASNPQLHQQSAMFLLSSPLPGTPQSSAPAMTEALQPFQHGQDINQFLQSQHMSMVNAGTLQVPVNQSGPHGMKNPLRAEVNSYYYQTSNITADYRLDSSPRPQMGIGATPPFIQAQIMRQSQHNFEQTANNPGSHPFRPQNGHLHTPVTQAKGYTCCGGPRHQMLLNMAIPQQEMQGSNGRALLRSEAGESSGRGRKRKVVFQDESPSPSHPEQLLNWFPQGLDNQRLESGGPTTFTPRYNISLYDPAFQRMGLPVDPHLRMFLAMNRKNVAPK